MLNFSTLPRSQQIILGVGGVGIGILFLVIVAMFASQLGTSLTGALDEELLPQEDDTLLPEKPVTEEAPEAGVIPPPSVPEVRIAYSKDTDELRYAVKDGESWRIETAATNALYYSHEKMSSMVIGTDGRTRTIHAVYVTRQSPSVRYATKTEGGRWTTALIDDRFVSRPHMVSIGLDALGRAHVMYVDSYSSTIKYATNASGEWVVTVFDDGRFPRNPSLVVDADGVAHVSYSNGEGFAYATNASGSWQSEVIQREAAPDVHEIRVGADGNVHVAYANTYARIVRYAVRRSGRWNVETVAESPSQGGLGGRVALAIDQAGHAHIVFRGPNLLEGQRVMYATNVSGSWVIEPATPLSAGSQYYGGLSLDVDQQGKAHLSFIVGPQFFESVRYTTNASGSWAPPQVLEPRTSPEASGTTIRVQEVQLLRSPSPGLVEEP